MSERRFQFTCDDINIQKWGKNELLVSVPFSKEHLEKLAKEIIFNFDDETLVAIHQNIDKYLKVKHKVPDDASLS